YLLLPEENLKEFPEMLDMFCNGHTTDNLLVVLCQSHSTALCQCINQDKIELMQKNERKLLIVIDEQEEKAFSSLKSINIQKLTNFQFNSDYLDIKSKNALLSKEVTFQGYRLKMRQLMGVGDGQTKSWMSEVMDWEVLARLVERRLVV